MSTFSIDVLAGTLRLAPGAVAGPAISSSRRAWAPRLVKDLPPDQAPAILGAAFALCGDAHRHAAQWALDSARGRLQERAPGGAEREMLRLDTLREHLRRIWLDWPSVVPGGERLALPSQLATCSLLREGNLAAAKDWVTTELLGMSPERWLEDWLANGEHHLAAWCERATTTPARLLRAARGLAQRWRVPLHALQAHAQPQELSSLVQPWRGHADWALAPVWQGLAAETGPWTRLHGAAAAAPVVPTMQATSPLRDATASTPSAWWRMGSRLADVAALAAEGGQGWLACGGVEVGAGEGLGYCEMARGLLVHRVQLERAGTANEKVLDWGVLAPTEWNFHPDGALARLLAAMPAHTPAPEVRLLAACFDPCVVVQVKGQQDHDGKEHLA